MVSLRSPEEIQPRISRRLGEDLGSGHDLGQIESDHRLAPFHQGGRNDGSRSPLVAPETTIRPKVARQRRFFSGKSPPLLSRMTSAPSPPVAWRILGVAPRCLTAPAKRLQMCSGSSPCSSADART